MRKIICCFLPLLILFYAAFGLGEAPEAPTGIVAKVTTKKGSLKLRAKAEERAKVLDQISNGACILVTEEGEAWSRVLYNGQTGYCKSAFLTFLREADPSMLNYRVLRKGDKGDDVLALKQRLQELGYIRGGSELTSAYNDVAAERVSLFQRQTGMTEDGVASQELQAFLFSDRAPACTQTLPKVRSRVKTEENGFNKVICGCCMGAGCECCNFTGWIYY